MTSRIHIVAATLAVLAAAGFAASAVSQPEAPTPAVAYALDGKILFPKDYRTWVYLSSGVDMAYVEGGGGTMHAFDNVFVDPAAYAAFRQTGTWPDKTMMVLELRDAEQHGSINKAGRFQTGRMAVEIHVKDTARFDGGWGFFAFGGGEAPARLLPKAAACYACHEAHAAVDTTFVQFYPTLAPLAKQKGTLSAAYLADEAVQKDGK